MAKLFMISRTIYTQVRAESPEEAICATERMEPDYIGPASVAHTAPYPAPTGAKSALDQVRALIKKHEILALRADQRGQEHTGSYHRGIVEGLHKVLDRYTPALRNLPPQIAGGRFPDLFGDGRGDR